MSVSIKKAGVYLITNVLEKKYYVGACVNYFADRWRNHQNYATSGYRPKLNELHRDMRRLGFDNFTFTVLEAGLEDNDYIYEREALHIATMKAQGLYLYNKKMKDSFKEKSEFQKQALRERRTGSKWSDEVKQKMSNSAKNRKQPMEIVAPIKYQEVK